MILNQVNIPIFVGKNAAHSDMKVNLLASIVSMGTHSICDKSQCIANTDWFLPSNMSRPYWDLFSNIALEHVAAIGQQLQLSSGRISNYWFQQYKYDNYHSWHVHPTCMFSNIYYLELPTNTQATFNLMGNEFTFEVAEGDILTFPNFLIHCSKPNLSNSTKTAIVFNTDYDEVVDTLKYAFAPQRTSCC